MSSPKSPGSGSGNSGAELSVGFVLLPEFTLSTLSSFVDALRLAADEIDRSRQVHCTWTILGADRKPVRSSCGIEITPWEVFDSQKPLDYVVVVGGLISGHGRIDRRTLAYLRQVDARQGSLIGVCTGSFALARAGLMKGYRCCVHWHHLEEFTKEFPDHRAAGDSVYVVDGRRITCSGGQSAIDVALYLIERHCGRSRALKVASGMVLEVIRGPKSSQPHPEAQWFSEIDSPLVKHAILLMEHQPSSHAVLIDEVAARLGVSVRTLVRAFQKCVGTTPANFLRALRMAHGRWEVLHSERSIGWIASDYGFSDASHFTRLFRHYYGITPAAARVRRTKAESANTQVVLGRKYNTQSVLEQVLWGDPLSFTAIDWPSEE